MKALKLVVACVAMLVSVSAFSQTDTTKRDTTKRDTTRRDTTRKDSLTQIQQAESASTMQQSQSSTAKQQFPAPNSGRNYIPVLGSFQSAQTDAENKSITITADENNAGKIWIEGLAPVRFYALLKAVPGTYKIPAQKQEDKSIAEGTVQYDDATKQINVCLGCGYNADASMDVATSSDASATTQGTETAKGSKTAKSAKANKAKSVVSFSGTKVDQGTVSTNQ